MSDQTTVVSDPDLLDMMRNVRRERYGGATRTFTLRTWVPEKYMLVDTENGQVWTFRLDVESGAITTHRVGGQDTRDPEHGK